MYDSKIDEMTGAIKQEAVKQAGKPLRLQFSASHGGFHSPYHSELCAQLNKIAYSRNPVNETDKGDPNAKNTIKMVFEHMKYQFDSIPESLSGEDLTHSFRVDTKANGYTHITAHEIDSSSQGGNWLNNALTPMN